MGFLSSEKIRVSGCPMALFNVKNNFKGKLTEEEKENKAYQKAYNNAVKSVMKVVEGSNQECGERIERFIDVTRSYRYCHHEDMIEEQLREVMHSDLDWDLIRYVDRNGLFYIITPGRIRREAQRRIDAQNCNRTNNGYSEYRQQLTVAEYEPVHTGGDLVGVGKQIWWNSVFGFSCYEGNDE